MDIHSSEDVIETWLIVTQLATQYMFVDQPITKGFIFFAHTSLFHIINTSDIHPTRLRFIEGHNCPEGYTGLAL